MSSLGVVKMFSKKGMTKNKEEIDRKFLSKLAITYIKDENNGNIIFILLFFLVIFITSCIPLSIEGLLDDSGRHLRWMVLLFPISVIIFAVRFGVEIGKGLRRQRNEHNKSVNFIIYRVRCMYRHIDRSSRGTILGYYINIGSINKHYGSISVTSEVYKRLRRGDLLYIVYVKSTAITDYIRLGIYKQLEYKLCEDVKELICDELPEFDHYFEV